MAIVDLEDAEREFERLIERAEAGELIILAKNGKALVQLVPVEGPGAGRDS